MSLNFLRKFHPGRAPLRSECVALRSRYPYRHAKRAYSDHKYAVVKATLTKGLALYVWASR